MSLPVELYQGLEVGSGIGSLFELGHGRYVLPFVCCSHQFVASFDALATQGEEIQTSVRSIVQQDARHDVSTDAYLLKFAANVQSEDEAVIYPSLPASHADRMSVLRKVPDCLKQAVSTFLTTMPAVNEFYFVAGAVDERRTRHLNAWYDRISDGLALDLGFSRIQCSGEWYGYRKADGQRPSKNEG